MKNLLLGFSVILSASFIGCSNASLYKGQLTVDSTAAISFCTTPAANVVTNLKYIFVFDISGSTIQNYFPQDVEAPPYSLTNYANYAGTYGPDPLGGTDIYGERRFGSLINFLGQITDTPNTYYAAILFGDTPSLKQAWLTGGVKTALAATQAKLGTYCVNNAQNPDPNCTGAVPNGGNTDYQDTLADPSNSQDTNSVYGLIYTDILAAQQAQAIGQPFNASDYVIFWISDGAPYVQTNGVTALQPLAEIEGQVTSIVNLQTNYPDFVNSVTLNTGFFHLDHTVPAPPPPNGYAGTASWATAWSYAEIQDEISALYMQQMASFGRGQFIDFSSNTINYTKFNVPAQVAKFVLKDFWIHDASTVWWNGQLMLDSDNDGIPDVVELQMGSNPNAYDSDGNGLGDGVELKVYGSPCGDSKCKSNANMRQPAGGTAGPNNCTYKIATGSNVYGDQDCDFLNDYEESVLGSNRNDFDSNQDWVPDQFEFVSLVSFLSGTNSLSADPENDGITDYFKLKENLPINYPASQIHGVNPLNYTLTQVSDNTSQTCFQVNVQQLATMSSTDVVRAYVMEARGSVGSSRKMRVAQKITNGSLVLTDSDFTP